MINSIHFTSLANLPTPLDELPRLAKRLGLSKLLLKRDDLTGLAGGGNKARKLEYIFPEIISGGYDVVITAGGIQSNHARMTAAAARKLGLDIKLVLGGPDFTDLQGNILLDSLFGADIRYIVDDDANDRLTEEMERWGAELSAQGRKPYLLPIGGSTGRGALGYVKAMKELSGQFTNAPVQIITAIGSCGTFAGTILGCSLYLPHARVIGISVSRSVEAIRERTKELVRESAELLGHTVDADSLSLECYDRYHHEYGVMTNDGEHAIRRCAELEGILLDPVYTGKVMSALIDLSEKKIIDKNVPVIFIHTGGLPIIFSFGKELGRSSRCTKIYK
jgi:D-cysteine desulfhydrase family pyridoxal phosphate-dependent enzyme